MTSKQRSGPQFVLWRYRILLLVAVIPVFFVTLWQALKHKDLRFLCQRFGFLYPKTNNNGICIHAASVGEVLAAQPLIEKIQHEYQGLPIRISTGTPTGGRIARQRLKSVQHVYLPLDLHSLVNRFLDAASPHGLLVMETELWPNLYSACSKRQIPIIIVNGRLSRRTLQTKSWIKELYKITLSNVTAVLAKSAEDRQHFVELGANPKNSINTGNIKFAIAEHFTPPSINLDINRTFVLAASTHNNEEETIARIWQSLATHSRLLIIAPRHPYRTAEILKQLKALSLNVAVRSRQEQIRKNTDVYLADTLGELLAFMQQAELVFMGGSLVPIGGHNILEPAMLGKAIIFGPNMHNFRDETAIFLGEHAAIQVQGESELKIKLGELLISENKRRTLGDRARILMQQHKKVLDDYLAYINQYCPLQKMDLNRRSRP